MTRTGKCDSCFSSVSRPFGHGVQNFFRASHCLLMTGGVKCRKLGIFISSAFANFPGGALLFSGTHPCLSGNGTVDGWKDLGPGQTAPQSWSTAICWERGGGTGMASRRFLKRSCTALLVFRRFKTRNSKNLCESEKIAFRLKLEVSAVTLIRRSFSITDLLGIRANSRTLRQRNHRI